jgi:hypothetical protein
MYRYDFEGFFIMPILFVLYIKGLMSQYGGFHEILGRTYNSFAL